MAERTPPMGSIRHAWAQAHPFPLTTDVDERYAEFDRALAAHDAEVRASVVTEQPDPARVLADPKGGCCCTPYSQDGGGGYTEHSTHVYNPRTGVWDLAEEPVWEYGIRDNSSCTRVVMWGSNRERIESQMYRWPGSTLVKRVIAGEWVPVEQKGRTE